MPLRSDWSGSFCSIARSLDVVGDPWTVLILREALTGSRRYEQFKSALGTADNVLSRRLQAMVDGGLLERVPYRGEHRTHHEYRLTDAGADLLPVLNALAIWGEKHTRAPREDAHLAILHLPCGQVTGTADVCSNCGVTIARADVAWHRPWLHAEPTALAE